jgi:hypothetical protein
VFVDLAGTGGSAALNCTMYATAEDLVGDFLPLDAVRRCRAALAKRTDLRRYTTARLVDDLDDVRAALGTSASTSTARRTARAPRSSTCAATRHTFGASCSRPWRPTRCAA